MKKLRMNFLNEEGKKVTFTYAKCHQELSASVVQATMQTIADLQLISKKGLRQYETPDSANYIETIITDIF